MKNKNLKAR